MDDITNIREDLKQLKDYRKGVEFYKTNREEFEKPSNSIYVENNIAYISPLNDINNHFQEGNLNNVLLTSDRGLWYYLILLQGL